MPFVIAGAIVIGLSLGLMGSGGSILTVPMLVYLLGHNGKVAIAESLAIVGGIAAVTMVPYARSHLVNWRHVLFFGLPGMGGTYVGAWLSHFVPSTWQLILFAFVMLGAAILMIRNKLPKTANPSPDNTEADDEPTTSAEVKSRWFIAVEGILVGIITGLVGVGGGFLIVPALVIFGRLPMRVAIGTSLTVIAMNSFSGFYKYLDVLASLGESIDWYTVGAFVAVGVVGSFVGHALATRLNQTALRRVFAIFLIGMGLFVLGKETPKVMHHTAANSEHSAVVTDALAENELDITTTSLTNGDPT